MIKKQALFDYIQNLLTKITYLEKKNADLEKENAEMKEKLNFSTQYYSGEKAKEKAKEQLNKIAELEAQIEKMKCPWTCKKFSNCKLSNCPCDDWEIKDEQKETN
jgi:hypothetical protein